MNFYEVLSLVLGLSTTILGILLKAESDKRSALEQQVSVEKRKAYSEYSKVINEFLQSAKKDHNEKEIAERAKELIKVREYIWQYGSDEVVRSYSLWQQCMFSSGSENNNANASIVFMADLIIKMREDLRLSSGYKLWRKETQITPLDVLRIFLRDVDINYEKYVKSAKEFQTRMQKLNNQRIL